MYCSRLLVAVIVLCGCFVSTVVGFVHRIDQTFTKDRSSFQISDGYMYASKKGPFLMPKGSSTIHFAADILSNWEKNSSVHLNVVFYGAEEDDQDKAVRGLCSRDTATLKSNKWAKNVKLVKIKTLYSSCGAVDADCIYSVSVDETYEVKVEGWYNVIVAVCYEDLIYSQEKTMEIHSNIHSNPVVTTTGSIAFKNPFGYLPAEAYGLLPFEVMRAILYMLFAGYFVIHYFIYNQSVLPMHTMLLAVLLLCMVESIAWVAHYFYINYTGEPNCCPYPTYFILLNVLQILNATLLRLVLLIICLGYGIGRPRLLPLEIASISVLHLLYFIAASANQIYYFVHLNSYYMHSHMDYTQGAHYFRNNSLIIFEIVINAMLLSWIYISASSTIRILREFQQREKLKMYQRLMTIIYAFIFLFMVVTGLYILDDQHVIDWPWQMRWLQQAMFESLPLAIIIALAVLFKPTERSRLLAYTSQLPTEDPDDEDSSAEILRGHNRHGLNFHSALYDDAGDEVEMVERKTPSQVPMKSSTSGNRSTYGKLPSADVDDEYGLSGSD